MGQKLKNNPFTWKKVFSGNDDCHFLVLHNDEIHSFDYVIDSLVELCNHSAVQAEQCAIITHFKGKCEIKKGLRKEIETLQVALSKKGLITSVD